MALMAFLSQCLTFFFRMSEPTLHKRLLSDNTTLESKRLLQKSFSVPVFLLFLYKQLVKINTINVCLLRLKVGSRQKQLLIDHRQLRDAIISVSQTRKIRLICGDLLIISTIVHQFQTICSISKQNLLKCMFLFTITNNIEKMIDKHGMNF